MPTSPAPQLFMLNWRMTSDGSQKCLGGDFIFFHKERSCPWVCCRKQLQIRYVTGGIRKEL